MAAFRVDTHYEPTGDQPEAIESLSRLIKAGDRYQTLLGATGTGKSLGYDEPLFLVERGAGGQRAQVTEIGGVVDSLLERNRGAVQIVGDSEVLELESDYYVQAIDPASCEVGLFAVSAVTRHQAPAMYRLETSCGRSAVLTGDHNLWVLRDGQMTLIETREAGEGDYIPLPESLPGVGELAALDLLDSLPPKSKLYVHADEPLLELVGTSEGRASFVAAVNAGGKRGDSKLYALQKGLKGKGLVLEDFSRLLADTSGLRGVKGGWDPARGHIGGRTMAEGIPLHLELTDAVLRLLGHYVAEGHSTENYFTISTRDAQTGADVKGAARQLGITCVRDDQKDYRLFSSAFSTFLSWNLGSHARTKRLPGWWPQMSNSQLAVLLRAYFDGDGTVDKEASVSATTASERLASDLCYALLRFGIWARVRRVFKKATNSGHAGDWYYQVTIYGQEGLEAFQREIGFGIGYKRQALRRCLGRTANSNVDLVPLDGAELRALRQDIGVYQRELAATTGLSKGCVRTVEAGRRRPQRTTLKKLLNALAVLALERGCDEEWRRRWERLYSLTLVRWTGVKAVVPAAYDRPYVYDLTVPGAETFLAGRGGMFVHNTASMAWVIEQVQKPTLVIAHNKTLAAQLCNEFREFLPDNAVEYFVSYYDYYQPEAYMPSSDVYIEKDAQVNDDIDRLRHAATSALLSRRDVVIVASVSAIYGLGSPERYREKTVIVALEEPIDRDLILRKLVDIQYVRHDILDRGRFRVRGDTLEVQPASQETAYRLTFFGDEVEEILHFNPLTGEPLDKLGHIVIYPATQYVTDTESIERAVKAIEHELEDRLKVLEEQERVLEAHRLKQRTEYDLEMMQELGFCHGIENYSRHLEGRAPGTPPFTLLDYFPPDYICFIDESHQTVPQIGGMYEGDRSRKSTLIDYGFRLPSALDNRPLKFAEFLERVPQFLFVSATPGPFELEHSSNIAEQIIRPTGVVDPEVEVRPTTYQVDDLLEEVRVRTGRKERVLVTTLTKKMAEDLADYFLEAGVKAKYLHSDIQTLERIQVIRELRLGEYDVLVGVNLLREGLDLPEVSLVAILDADKEGFLRGKTALIQTIGRAARNVNGHVIMYADRISNAMAFALEETNRRRAKQVAYNEAHGIVPQTIIKGVSDIAELLALEKPSVPRGRKKLKPAQMSQEEIEKAVITLEEDMAAAAEELRFEYAAKLRDEIKALRRELQPY